MPRVDPLTRRERSERMALVKSKDTWPELVVRKAVWRLGFRYRLHAANVPGKPDIVLPRFRSAIFVHGCFWHRHHGCARTRLPKTRTDFWTRKFASNVARDRSVRARLARRGWRSLVIWECVSEDSSSLDRRLRRFLSGA
jgi:DNA mismatch endonuclease, patch repair protein